jgi:hypothetical protein
VSFILDALERARGEQAQTDESAIATRAGPMRAVVMFACAGSAAAFLLLLLVLWWQTGERRTPPRAEDALSAAQAEPAAEATSLGVDEAETSPDAAPEPGASFASADDLLSTAPDPAVQSLYARAELEAAGESDAEVHPAAGAEALRARASTEASAPPLTPSAAAPTETVEADPQRVDALLARAEAALSDRDLPPHPAPMLDELPATLRDAIPTLIYSRHDYRADGGESSVFINREPHRVGDTTRGVRIEDILPDSVVLSYRGTLFRLRALNSWVNL